MFWLVGGASPGRGSTITLESRVDCSATERAARCRVQLENRGDEAALDLRIELSFAGGESVSKGIASLEPGEKGAAEAELDLPPREGRHPVVVRLLYRDENGYPLSALSHAYILVGSDEPPRLEGVVEPLTLAGPRKLRWRLTSREPEAVLLTATLLLPRELSSAEAPRRLELDAGQSVRGSHLVAVSSALAESVYRVYLLIDYERGGRRQSLFLPADVRVAAARHSAGLFRREILIWLVLLAAAGTATQGLRLWRRGALPSVWSSR